jgi:hypothetical protein
MGAVSGSLLETVTGRVCNVIAYSRPRVCQPASHVVKSNGPEKFINFSVMLRTSRPLLSSSDRISSSLCPSLSSSLSTPPLSSSDHISSAEDHGHRHHVASWSPPPVTTPSPPPRPPLQPSASSHSGTPTRDSLSLSLCSDGHLHSPRQDGLLDVMALRAHRFGPGSARRSTGSLDRYQLCPLSLVL